MEGQPSPLEGRHLFPIVFFPPSPSARAPSPASPCPSPHWSPSVLILHPIGPLLPPPFPNPLLSVPRKSLSADPFSLFLLH
ncbi:hypothetical protein E2C01_065985 [Portunus trituberculatus]|uniref:Uncharacterized protein n=1 Tax=Portunus trituberculatus TaxID=210409 RepID=A0A5B7HH16_PORTR|nr:hypothetical protein [Portunus trituberculatus]